MYSIVGGKVYEFIFGLICELYLELFIGYFGEKNVLICIKFSIYILDFYLDVEFGGCYLRVIMVMIFKV